MRCLCGNGEAVLKNSHVSVVVLRSRRGNVCDSKPSLLLKNRKEEICFERAKHSKGEHVRERKNVLSSPYPVVCVKGVCQGIAMSKVGR